jgi:hypothetical protein
MFGQDNQDEDISAVNPTLNGSDTSTPATDDAPVDSPANDVAAATVIQPTAPPDVAAAASTPEVPETSEEPEAEAAPEVSEPAPEETPTVDPSDTDTTDVSTVSAPSADDTALLDLKKQALEELSPLLDQLDQTPEEKFKTTMMMIQATDSSDLVTTAHEAALKITDEKVRAQALLDIVNEINYFTQPKE